MPGRHSEAVREKAVIALLTATTLEAAARQSGVGLRTLKSWLKEPDFQVAYAEARRRYLELSLGRLQRASGKATTTLIRLLGAANAAVSLRASLGLLDRAVKGAEMLDLMERVEQLEQAAKRRK